MNLFTDWCNRIKNIDNLFKIQLPNVWSNGNVPVITWEPYLCSAAATPADVTRRAADGEYDAYLNAWADRLGAFVGGPDGVLGNADDRRAYVRMAHEMNGNWYPWSGNSTEYVRMWRRVRGAFVARNLTASRVQWIWAVNHEDVGGVAAESYYPGDAHVDWIGIDGYNWGSTQGWSSWKTPREVFDPMIARLRAATRALLSLTETASTSVREGGAADIAGKSAWIAQFFNYTQAAGVRMVIWFNEDKETDWGDASAAAATATRYTRAAASATRPTLPTARRSSRRACCQPTRPTRG
ncbi:hypothetical protein ACHAW5_008658 [Stephanodiscus triporus]|uniref:GH26 domain-containing protein n=1 Tax=Stephanodiscus triporus TaxID=2934178 RepID=A0ABD3MU92_9STRA